MVNRSTPEQRRDRIAALVQQRGSMTVDELVRLLGSSAETVRRDLGLLARARRLRKVHGGAVPSEMPEGPFAERLQVAVAEKRAIGAAAAGLFGRGESLFVDTGSTTLLFAQALGRRGDLTVITNGLEIARAAAEGGNKTFLIGGEYRPRLGEAVGPLALEQVGRFHADHAVLTVGALGPDGPMDFDVEEAQVARAMVAQAARVTVLADRTKLGRTALFQVCALDRVDRLVTDRAPDASLSAGLAGAAVELIVADAGA